ncbi:hypothetical protein Tsp_04430 [Trichinella spiralis]|uniref:hypothetical protein n=1 Tax=Trichinella spiralis TaxID=6334 RepID=UPI0001EFCAF9|nr:hypothetical protein Tsp_04430 [Trichinella spiralis]
MTLSHLCGNGRCLKSCAMGSQHLWELVRRICLRGSLCKFAIDVVLRLCFSANLVVIVTPPRGTIVNRGLL